MRNGKINLYTSVKRYSEAVQEASNAKDLIITDKVIRGGKHSVKCYFATIETKLRSFDIQGTFNMRGIVTDTQFH